MDVPAPGDQPRLVSQMLTKEVDARPHSAEAPGRGRLDAPPPIRFALAARMERHEGPPPPRKVFRRS